MTIQIERLFEERPDLKERLQRVADAAGIDIGEALETALDVILPEPNCPADMPPYLTPHTHCAIQGGEDEDEGNPPRSCGTCYTCARRTLSQDTFADLIAASPYMGAAHAAFNE